MRNAVLIMIVSFVGMVTQAFSLNYRSIDIYIDGVRYTGDKAFLIEDTTYVPVRMLSQAIRNCSVYWGEPTRTATVSANDLNVQITAGFNYIIANGRYLYSPKPVRIWKMTECTFRFAFWRPPLTPGRMGWKNLFGSSDPGERSDSQRRAVLQ